MGMYTGLRLDVILRAETPAAVLQILDHMLKSEGEEVVTPDDPFFKTERWNWMLRGTSAYLDEFKPDSFRNNLNLKVQFQIKNYTQEIERFLAWISPYVEQLRSGAFRYEEMKGEVPITFKDGVLEFDYNHPNAEEGIEY